MQLGTLRQQMLQTLLELPLPVEQATAEVDWMLEAAGGFTPSEVLASSETELTASAVDSLLSLVKIRAEKRIPVQYLLHQAWFYGLRFYVNPSVLIPRPETEILVEQVLALYQPDMHILDVGTGPGTIAIAVSRCLKNPGGILATDISPEALKVARLNQRMLGTNVEFRPAGDWFAPVAGERFDVIVSNPPYVDPALKPTLMPEVLQHEPALALFPPGDDAYCFYRRLAEEAPQHLNANGWLLVEFGMGMASTVQALLQQAGFQEVTIHQDLAGLDRFVQARWL